MVNFKTNRILKKALEFTGFFHFRIKCRNSSHLPISTINYSVADNTVFGITDHVSKVSHIVDLCNYLHITY